MKRKKAMILLSRKLQIPAPVVFAVLAVHTVSTKTTLGLIDEEGSATKTFSFEVCDKVTIRKKPTTQVAIRIAEWPAQTFLLSLPEAAGDLWQ